MENKKSNFADRLREALKNARMSQSNLCKVTGIAKSSMSQYLKGLNMPSFDKVKAISEALWVEEAWLMGYDVPMRPEYEPSWVPAYNGPEMTKEEIIQQLAQAAKDLDGVSLEPLSIKFADYFPLPFNLNLSCGSFEEIMEAEPDSEVYVPIRWQWAKKRLHAFKLNGTSMNKLFYDGSVVVTLDNNNGAEVYKDGTPVVVWLDGKVTFKRLYDKGNNLLLIPDSSDSSHQPIILDKETDQMKIVGKIIYHVPPDDVDGKY